MKMSCKSLPKVILTGVLQTADPALAQAAAPTLNVALQKSVGQVTPTGPVPSPFVLNSDGAILKDGKLTRTGVDKNAIVSPIARTGPLAM